MNYLQKKKLAFMSIVNGVKGFFRTISGVFPLTLDGCVDNNSIVDYKIYGESVQDGTPTPDHPIEIESVGEKTINLYTGQSEYTYSTTTNSTHHSYYEAFEIGKTYTLYCYIDNTQGTAVTRFRISIGKKVDGNNTWEYHNSSDVAAGSIGYSKVTIAIPDTYNGLLNMQYQVNGGTTTFKDIMLVEGSYTLSALPEYVKPYKIPIKINDEVYDIYARFPLMKFGEYVDYIDFTNQKIIRNINRGGLNGSHTWSISGNRFYLSTSNLNIKCLGVSVAGIMSNALRSATWNSIRNSGTGIATYTNNRIDIRADGVWTTTDEVKAYLSSNPMSYIAPCLTPWEEEVELPQIPTVKGVNIIDTDTIIKPSYVEITYYSTTKG